MDHQDFYTKFSANLDQTFVSSQAIGDEIHQLLRVAMTKTLSGLDIVSRDEFDAQQQNKNYITIIIPFTNLDVYIGIEISTTEDAIQLEMVLCYIRPFTSLLIQKGLQYRFEANTAILDKRLLDIKFISLKNESGCMINDLETEV